MRTRVTILLAAIFMISSAIPAFADHDRDRDHDRKEYKWNKRNPDRHDRRHKGDMRNPDRYGDRRHKGDLRNPDRYYKSKKYRDYDDDDWEKMEKKWRKEAKKRYKREREYREYMEYRHQPRYYAPPVRHAYRPLPDYYDRQFRKMVRRAVRGGRDVAVWQVDDDTFVVRYLYGNRYYTQYLYPYTGRYGSRNRISVNWSPNSVWNLIPSIHLNLDL